MIVVRGVAYDYPTARVLHDVSFEVPEGAVLALVGPNGAGKTTLLRCMAALDAPAEGSIRITGVDTQADPRAVHAALGYLPDFYGLYDQLSVRQALVYAARSRDVPTAAAEAAAREAAQRVHLDDRLDQLAGQLSRGLRQRLAIAQTLVHRPRVLLLDEPAAGLDPEARRSLSDLIRRLSGEGMTIVVSSHILAELEDYSTRMLMLREGRVAGGGVVSAHGPAASAPPDSLKLKAVAVSPSGARPRPARISARPARGAAGGRGPRRPRLHAPAADLGADLSRPGARLGECLGGDRP